MGWSRLNRLPIPPSRAVSQASLRWMEQGKWIVAEVGIDVKELPGRHYNAKAIAEKPEGREFPCGEIG